MKELVLRTVFGALYVALIVFCIQFEAAFTLLVAVLMLGVFIEINRIKTSANLPREHVFSLAFGLAVLFWAGYASYIPPALPFIFVALTAAHLVFVFKSRQEHNIFTFPSFLLYTTSGLTSLVLLPKLAGEYNHLLPLGLFIAIWTNDTFAYISGRMLGRHKLAPALSPNKTWEGFVGGVVFAAIAGWLFAGLEGSHKPIVWAVLFVVAAIAGTIGDLLQSKMKRYAGLKDSGNIIPGHGGIFDRLDSVIFAAPFMAIIIYLIHLL